MSAVKEVQLQPVLKEAPMVPTPDMATQIIALASDPNMDVGKLEKLMQMQREMVLIRAKADFDAAMVLAQQEMRPISADGYNKQTSSHYATYAKLDQALRPIYNKHGFGLSFNTAEGAPTGWVRVVCDVSHAGGFSKQYHVDMPADGKGPKGGDVMTVTHAVGAGLSYGMRYLLKMIWNVLVGEDDRDGNAPEEQADDPTGFVDWAHDLEIVAKEQGLDPLREAWKKSRAEFRDHMTKHYNREWERMKATAAKVQR